MDIAFFYISMVPNSFFEKQEIPAGKIPAGTLNVAAINNF